MKIVLCTDVPKIGKKNEVKEVSDGYAANYLFPKGLAERATEKRVERIQIDKKAGEADKEVQHELLKKNLQALKGATITLSEKANEQGHLYEGVHIPELLSALKEQAHIDLAEEHIVLEHPIKEVGEHIIPILVGESKGSFTIAITAA